MIPREAHKGILYSVRRDDTAGLPVTQICLLFVGNVAGEFRPELGRAPTYTAGNTYLVLTYVGNAQGFLIEAFCWVVLHFQFFWR